MHCAVRLVLGALLLLISIFLEGCASEIAASTFTATPQDDGNCLVTLGTDDPDDAWEVRILFSCQEQHHICTSVVGLWCGVPPNLVEAELGSTINPFVVDVKEQTNEQGCSRCLSTQRPQVVDQNGRNLTGTFDDIQIAGCTEADLLAADSEYASIWDGGLKETPIILALGCNLYEKSITPTAKGR